MAGDCKRQYKQLHDEHKSSSSPPASSFQILGPSSNSIKIGSPSTGTSPLDHNMNAYMFSKSADDNTEICGSFNSSMDVISKKTLFYLISTLNASFQPDYDFTNTNSSEFSREPSLDFVIKSVDNFLASVDNYSKLKQQLWDTIDKEINLNECEYYRYFK